MSLRRSVWLVLVLAAVAGCESDQAPTIEAGGAEVTTTTAVSTTATTEYRDAAPVDAETQVVELALTGDTEVPGPGSTGTAEATLTYDGNELCVEGTTTGVGALIGGHVHAGLVGESGPIVVDLGITTGGDGPFEGCAVVGAEGGVVLVDPTAYYLNVHTADFPEGAVRAQLG